MEIYGNDKWLGFIQRSEYLYRIKYVKFIKKSVKTIILL